MSTDDILTEEDHQLLDAIDTRIDTAEDASDYERIARDLRAEFREHRAEFRQFKHDVEERLDALEDGAAQDDDADGPPIVQYAQIPPEERADLLSKPEQIAVTLHERWDDIAWKLGGGSSYSGRRNTQKVGVDTKTKANAKYNPSKLRHRLKDKLDCDIQAKEIYDGMKRLAQLSGGEKHVDDATGRTRVVGGEYHFEERATPDNKDTVRVLWRVEG